MKQKSESESTSEIKAGKEQSDHEVKQKSLAMNCESCPHKLPEKSSSNVRSICPGAISSDLYRPQFGDDNF